MREIKFRVWNKEYRVMSKSFTLADLDPVNGQGQFDWEDGTYLCFDETDFKKLIWVEYTGLKDKNGKEIYEGDVVEFQAGYYKALKNRDKKDIVVFNDGCFKTKKYQMLISAIPNCKILGNIYENPKLKGGKG